MFNIPIFEFFPVNLFNYPQDFQLVQREVVNFDEVFVNESKFEATQIISAPVSMFLYRVPVITL